MPATPDAAPEQASTVAPAMASSPAVASSADRLPALILPGQPVPAAVLRDLPEWVATEVVPAQTAGTSGDESAAPAVQLPAQATQPRQRQRTEAPPRKERQDRYGAVFARCPGPGQSGAVECRRAVCGGAARKESACGPYLN
jgi:hypothetical protein